MANICRLSNEFVRCGSLTSVYTKTDFLQLVGKCLTNNPSMDGVFDTLAPIGIIVNTSSNKNRFDVLKSCVFKLSKGEFVRIHCHSADKKEGAHGNTVSGETCRIDIDSEVVFLEGNVANCAILLPGDARWDDAHMPISR